MKKTHFLNYIKLARLDKPLPIFLLLFPVLWTMLLASKDIISFLSWLLPFMVGAVFMRSAGCVINDLFDRDIDIEVERTKDRPIARKKVTIKEALWLIAALLLVPLILFFMIPLQAKYSALVAMVLTIIYPLAKRYSNYPQAVLGLTFNMGVFIAWYTLEVSNFLTPLLIYLSAALWTFGYDTIYALQDIKFDKELKLGSAAISLEPRLKQAISQFYVASISLLGLAVLTAQVSLVAIPFLIFAGYVLFWQVESLKIESAQDAVTKFNSNILYGAVVTIAILLGKVY